jgi:hypothetical protein
MPVRMETEVFGLFGRVRIFVQFIVMVTETASQSRPKKEQDWADISDDEEEEVAPVVQVDSLDLSALSLNGKEKISSTGIFPKWSSLILVLDSTETETTGKSLADRISSDKPIEKEEEMVNSKEIVISQPDEKEAADTKQLDTNLIQNKYEVAVKLQDLQADPNSPLYSVKSFEELGLYNPLLSYINTDIPIFSKESMR